MNLDAKAGQKKALTTGFPSDFLWGCATSAYQIEGAPLADGAGPSIWQRFVHTPGMVHNGDTGDIACDHYHRYKSDIALMKKLGIKAYRFSISWSRLLPLGKGPINAAGLAFYNDLIDTLIEHDIEPIATLFHWDLPAALDDQGGWLNRDSADWFAQYAQVAFRAFDGRVRKWITLNEPWVVSDGGYLFGTVAPGHRNLYEAAIVAHNLMRAHGAAVKAYRDVGQYEIGLVVNIEPKYPATQSAKDVEATQRASDYMNALYLDAALLGRYPASLNTVFGDAWPEWPTEDLRLINQKLDFLGINYYTRSVTQHDDETLPLRAKSQIQPQGLYTQTNWEVYPKGMTDTLCWVKDRYGDIALYIMENGAAFEDPPIAGPNGVHDPLRSAYLRAHINAMADAMDQGVNVKGYMVWSFLDNLEWSLGFSKRFGIVHVNFKTQERTPKDSAYVYREIITSNGRQGLGQDSVALAESQTPSDILLPIESKT